MTRDELAAKAAAYNKGFSAVYTAGVNASQ